VATWILVRLVNILADVAKGKLEDSDRRAAVAVVPLGARTLKAFLLVIAGLALLQNLGFNVSGLIAGLGVGGLAVALAAQKTIANLFGGVSIIADQPVRVGDFCRYGDGQVGTVEEIGIRSTRVRSLDRTLVTVPNSDFSELRLENFAVRDRMRLHVTIGLRYETSPDQLRHVLTGLRKMLIAHPHVFEELRRVRFVGFGASSLDLEIFTYITTEDWNEFLAIREDIFLRVMDIVADSGTGFAFPSQTLYLGRDSGLDPDRTERAEGEVSKWRDATTLPFPEFSAETTAGIAPLEYPPPGSETRPSEPADG
jgi:MscS family membrane protein